MSNNLSDYGEGKVIDHLFRTATLTKPTNWYVALFTVAPTDAGGGTEVTGGAYARVAVSVADASWAAPSSGNGTTSNLGTITFPAPTADWGTVVAVGLFDASSAGNMWFYGTLTANKVVHLGDPTPQFAAGTLVIAFG